TATVTSATVVTGQTIGAQVDMLILNNWQISQRKMQAPKIVMVLWKAPSFLWVKANTDGSWLPC
ncbi:hypothetical protein A2U01_0062414, partial [Trifolium medium]|nr:hypothetical protein [Trifolium medium]